MALVPGTRLGPFEITAQIGVGGMGEVYRATDSKLKRQVAIKVLPDAVAADQERLARFQREAEVLAALNHPNIAAIYGLEETPSAKALVMELVEGPTLADRIRQGPIPIDEALPIAKQITEALEAAHEQGIIHRDLKPANIKVREDGTVKVLDFGLAKALSQDPGRGTQDSSQSPTITTPAMTQMGMILGTAAYMSPEQAKGRPADKRADIWAFGVVLYEMLTGRSMFEAETVSEMLAAVLRADIDLEALPADTPRTIRRLLARCLDRVPNTRLRDIGEARIALDTPEPAEAPEAAAAAATAPRSWVPLAVAVAATAVLAALVAWNLRPEPSLPSPVAFSLVTGTVADYAVSPDGTRVAYVTSGDIWVRDLDDLEPRLVASPGRTASFAGSGLFWSWDSTELGFAATGALWRVAAEGGTAVQICRLENEAITGAAWGPDGRIVFASWRGGLYEVPASGAAAPVLLVEAGSGIEDFHGSRFLPNGALMYTPHWTDPHQPELHIQHDGSTTIRSGFPGGTYVQGHLILQRGGPSPGLWALPFDLDRLEITGEPVLIVPGATSYSASADGTLVYETAVVEGEVASRLGWRDAAGTFEALPGVARNYAEVALSPDGATAAAIVVERGERSIALVDMVRGGVRPLVAASSNRRFALRWSFDSRFVFFSESRGFANHIVVVPADGGTPPRDVVQGQAAAPTPDGRSLVFLRDERGSYGLWTVALDDNQPVGDPRRLRESPQNLEHPAVSPDGTLVAYAERPGSAPRFSSEYNVFISRLPDGTGQWPVSVAGGNMPTWDARTGNLIYLTRSDVMTVPIVAGATPDIGTPTSMRPLHDAAWLASIRWPRLGLSTDGQRYLVLEPEESEADREPGRLVVVRPWFPTGR